jgi:predicted metal-dependent HD superfamily phosphohydrolase
MLQQTFVSLVRTYTQDAKLTENLWREIAHHYTGKGRHYHDLSHLEHVLRQLTPVRDELSDRDTVFFTLFYHDAIYDALRSDNEEKSAELARYRLQQLDFPQERIARCEQQILATKSHSASEDPDTNLFTDADLSILGSDPEAYAAYSANVRKEYAVYPDALYSEGRKKVLAHFLAMPRIYKTLPFRERFESSARQNLTNELSFL